MRSILAICLLFSMGGTGISAEAVTGSAFVHDGDDLILNGTDYRLNGIDAFEHGQTCQTLKGDAIDLYNGANEALSKLIKGKTVSCTSTGEHSRERIIGRCTVGSLSVEKEMVRSGWATVRKDYAKERIPELCAIEMEARKAGRGASQCQSFMLPIQAKHKDIRNAGRMLCREDFNSDGTQKRD